MSAKSSWSCCLCGYIHYGENPPDSCPICGAYSTDFIKEEVVAAPEKKVTKWVCLNCTYIHEGPEPPDECLICGAPADNFEPVIEEEDTADINTGFSGHVVVVGAGIAGVSAVESIREHAPDSSISLLSREDDIPYYRLNLTRYLAGEVSMDDLPLHQDNWYTDNNISLKTGCDVAEIKPAEKIIELRGGANLNYDKLILTAGSHPFLPPIPGTAKNGVYLFRTCSDARKIMKAVKTSKRCICIGGGVLGLETAAALAKHGIEVCLLERHDWLMPRQLNSKAGNLLEKHIKALGVEIIKQARSKELTGDEHVAGVLLEDGRIIEGDMVVIAAGVRPNSHIARREGFNVNQGVVVNNHLQTSYADIYAAGDICEHNGQLYGNWYVSQFQGKIAGANAVGQTMEFGGVPRSNALKVLGLDMLSIGSIQPLDGSYDTLEEQTENSYKHLVFHDGRLVGAILLGDATAAGTIKQLIENRTDCSHIYLSTGSPSEFIGSL